MQPSTLAKRGWLVLFGAIAAFYFWGLGSLPLLGPDEPRYAQVAREMFLRRDLITPTLGGLPWFEKPPLLYWLMMAGYRLFGITEFAARVGPAVCGLLTGVIVYWAGRSVATAQREHEAWDGLGRWSAFAWLTSFGAIVFARGASFDIVVTATLTMSLSCFLVWLVRQPYNYGGQAKGSSLLLVGFYGFIGLSFLAKGLIGFLIPFGVVGLLYVVRREWPRRTFFKSLLWGLPLAIVIAGIWFGPMVARHGWFFVDQFIVQHHFARFVSNKYHHPGPFYFYLPVLIGLSLPWAIVLLGGLVSALRWSWPGVRPIDKFRTFSLMWLILPIVFFSFSSSKLTAYILPALPAVALLVGERITCLIRFRRGVKVLRLTGSLLILLAVGAGWYLLRVAHLSPPCALLVGLPLALAGLIALIYLKARETVFALIGVSVLVTSIVALECAAPTLSRKESVRDLLSAAAARGYGQAPVVQLHTVERTAEFYAAGRLAYRPDGEPVKLEGAMQVADEARIHNGPVLCFVPLEFVSQLTSAAQLETEILADNTRVALVAVRTRSR